MANSRPRGDKLAYGWMGGSAGAMAVLFTHPLDLIKATLQIEKTSRGMMAQGAYVYKYNNGGARGCISLYNGLTASIGRQLTYSMVRFAAFDAAKVQITGNKRNYTTVEKVSVAFVAGCMGGIVGTPCDLVNVRMQGDVITETAKRRNYSHVFNGLRRIQLEEGGKSLMKGYEMATARAGMMTVGQIAMYEVFKENALEKLKLDDNIATHFLCSSLAGMCGALFTMPLDVMKTKIMNQRPGEFTGVVDAVTKTFKAGGPKIFFSGFVPAAIRIMPHTILTWVFKEQLRLNLGYFPEE